MTYTLHVSADLATATADEAALAADRWELLSVTTHPAGPPALVMWFFRDPTPPPPPPPNPQALVPSTGDAAGGESVIVVGQNLTGATQVTFGGASATNVVVAGATSVRCDTPPHAPGPVDVVVTGPGGIGIAPSGFLYQ